jgi:hypothetical protein
VRLDVSTLGELVRAIHLRLDLPRLLANRFGDRAGGMWGTFPGRDSFRQLAKRAQLGFRAADVQRLCDPLHQLRALAAPARSARALPR